MSFVEQGKLKAQDEIERMIGDAIAGCEGWEPYVSGVTDSLNESYNSALWEATVEEIRIYEGDLTIGEISKLLGGDPIHNMHRRRSPIWSVVECEDGWRKIAVSGDDITLTAVVRGVDDEGMWALARDLLLNCYYLRRELVT